MKYKVRGKHQFQNSQKTENLKKSESLNEIFSDLCSFIRQDFCPYLSYSVEFDSWVFWYGYQVLWDGSSLYSMFWVQLEWIRKWETHHAFHNMKTFRKTHSQEWNKLALDIQKLPRININDIFLVRHLDKFKIKQ